MASILPVSDLRNYNEVLKNCQIGEPVFLTKNGRGRFVVMDIEDYERDRAEKKLLEKLHWRDMDAAQFYVISDFGYGVDYFFIIIKRYAVLAIIAKPDSCTDVKQTCIGLHYSLQEFDKGGFSHSIDSNDAQFLITGKDIAEIVEYHFLTIFL